MASVRRSRGAALAIWLSLNFLRLIGLGALLWTIVVHGILLKRDATSRTGLATNAVANASIPTSLNSILKLTPTEINTPPPGVAPVTYVTVPNPPVPTITTAANVPSLLFPGGAVPTSLATEPVIPMISAPAEADDPKSNLIGVPQKRDIKDESSGVAQEQYLGDSTVPNQSGGMVFAVVSRIYSIFALSLLGLAELGVPELFLLQHLSAMSLVGSPLWLGLGKIWFGVDLQRHFIPAGLLLAGQIMIASGLLNVLVAIPLFLKQRRANRVPQLRSREVYFDLNVSQRLCFWKPIPDLAYILAYDRKGMNAIQERLGEDTDDGSAEQDEKHDIESRGSEDREDYPTFTGRGLEDPTSQIERFERRLRKDEHSDDDGDGEEGYLEDAKPAPPEVMPGIPPQLQGMVRNVRPRFGAPTAAVPAINLLPSTPSTIASRSRSRPQTISSIRSGGSDVSTRSRRMTLIQEAAGRFPVPPDRTPEDVTPRSKPKPHLVNPKMDESRLMPPRGHSRRTRSEVSEPLRPVPRCNPSAQDVQDESQDISQWRMPTRPASSIKPRQSVRFDLKRASSESTSSVHGPAHRASTYGQDVRQEKSDSRATSDRYGAPRPYVEDDDT